MWNTIEEIINSNFKITEDLAMTRKTYGISTGFDELDSLLNGLQPCNLITIGAESCVGKSAFMLNIIKNVAIDNKIPVLLFSSEMDDLGVGFRLLSIVSSIELEKLMTGMLTANEWGQLDFKMHEIKNSPLYVESTHQLYIEDVVKLARKAVQEKGVKLIAVDYLQLMYHKVEMNDSRYVEINAIISQLKSLAMELNVPVIVLSQLNKRIDERDYNLKTPQPSDLRDSGTIFSDSDVVLFIERPEMYHIYKDSFGNDIRHQANIIIAKQRNGNRNFSCRLKFDNETLEFCEFEKEGTTVFKE